MPSLIGFESVPSRCWMSGEIRSPTRSGFMAETTESRILKRKRVLFCVVPPYSSVLSLMLSLRNWSIK